MTLILASKSKARREMMEKAGIAFTCVPADIDESRIQSSGLPPADIAAALAREKALAVAHNHTDALVIGADQVMAFEGRCLAKPESGDAAFRRFQMMRGKTHSLITSVCIAHKNAILFEHQETADLTMWNFLDGFLQDYCGQAGDALTATVGGYEIEGRGIRLFEKIEGDYFGILGMPLLPLLQFLRNHADIA